LANIYGNSGNDSIIGLTDDDLIYAFDGEDTVRGEVGSDRLFGANGNDIIYGGTENDFLFGGNGNDTLFGEEGNDILYGENGNNLLYGGNGYDTLNGGLKPDLLLSSTQSITGYDFNNNVYTQYAVITNCTYNNLGQLSSEEIFYYALNISHEIINYTYDDAGKILSKSSNYQDQQGFVLKLSEFTYDDKDNVLKEDITEQGTSYIAPIPVDFQESLIYTYSFDNQGKILEKTIKHYDVTDNFFLQETSIFTYNNQGQVLTETKTTYSEGNKMNSESATYTYDTLGNVLSKTTKHYDANDELLGQKNSEYSNTYSLGGNDTLFGGEGNDSYFVHSTSVQIVENLNQGTDTVYSSVSHSLGTNLENLVLIGNDNINGTGNNLKNIITGNNGNNLINGGGNVDTMIGGIGNDTYIVASANDKIVENQNQGIDKVLSLTSYTLADNIENMSLYTDNTSGTGNSNDNYINGVYGKSIIAYGMEGNDTLEGISADSTLYGGTGNDLYLIGNNSYIFDSEGNDKIRINNSKNNYIFVKDGNDLLITDKYIYSDYTFTNYSYFPVKNTIKDWYSGNKIETVEFNSIQKDTLSANDIESQAYYLINGTNNSDTILGNTNNNIIKGYNGADIIQAGAGNDIIIGGAGNDMLYGGDGNDIYRFGSAWGNDTIYDISGNDILSFDGDYDFTYSKLGNNLTISNLQTTDKITILNWFANPNYVIETIEPYGHQAYSTDYINDNVYNYITFGSSSDTINGTVFNDVISAGAGNDTVIGGIRNDSLSGGLGNDVYVFNTGDGQDKIYDVVGTDIIKFGAGITLNNLSYAKSGNNLVITYGTNDQITVQNQYISENAVEKVVFSDKSYIYISNPLVGTSANDTYTIDSTNSSSRILENSNGGTDLVNARVSYTLTPNTENLTLKGTGSYEGYVNGSYSVIYGNPVLWGSYLDYYQGDNTQNMAGSCLYVAIENMLIQAGFIEPRAGYYPPYTGNDKVESALVSLAELIDSGDFSIDALSEAFQSIVSEVNPYTGSIDIDTALDIKNYETDLITVANYLKEDRCVIALCDSDVLWGNSSILAKQDHAITVTGVVYDKSSNGIAGFYICDSGRNLSADKSRFISYDLMSRIFCYSDSIGSIIATSAGSKQYLDFINGTGNNQDNYIIGNDGKNILFGMGGNDTLNGSGQIDSLYGGAGNDVYLVNERDSIIENENEGSDTVYIATNNPYTIGNNIENLFLVSPYNANLVGNSLNNIMCSLEGNDTIWGAEGNDSLNGAGGTNYLYGGTGNDIYVISSSISNHIQENENEGIDEVQSAINYTLGMNMENLTLIMESNAYLAIGNSLNNTIIGNSKANSIYGRAGNDTIYGGIGIDNLYGESGNDTYVFNKNDGTDSILDDYLTGAGYINAGDNDVIKFGSGISFSNLIFSVLTPSNPNLIISFKDSNDRLTVLNQFSYTDRRSSIEKIILSDGSHFDYLRNVIFGSSTSANLSNFSSNQGLLVAGSAGNDTINGLNSTDLLYGYDGNDTIYGALGADILIGGKGNDVYKLSDIDTIIELANEGTDLINSSISYTLGANLENLTLIGAVSGTGNSLANLITGSSLANILNGGTAGNDTLIGDNGNDTYIINRTGIIISEKAGEGTDLVKSDISYTLGQNLENLILTGENVSNGVGNTLDNIIVGNSANNYINPGTDGIDKLYGGNGNDTYIINHSDVTIIEKLNEGTDLIRTSISFTMANYVDNLILLGGNAINATGNASDNRIVGNSANNIFDAGTAGNDSIFGDNGDDTYLINHSGTLIYESAGQGTDVVQTAISYTLARYVENLILTGRNNINGTGNAIDNIITGNSARNLLDAGIAGMDTLAGGVGNDTYLINHTDVTVTENAGEGIDLIESKLSYTLGDNLEYLTLTGVGNINAVGNSLSNALTGNSYRNIVEGNDGNDVITGGKGQDSLYGGANDDTYNFASGDNIDIISDTSGTIDKIKFLSDVDWSKIALFRGYTYNAGQPEHYIFNSDNLIIDYSNAVPNDKITVLKQFAGESIERIYENFAEEGALANHYLSNTTINTIVAHIAAYDCADGVANIRSVEDVKNNQELMAYIANQWLT